MLIMATVRYMVNDVESAIKFYTQLLGFELEQNMGSVFAIISRDVLKLWLSGPNTSAARPMPDGRQPVAGGWNRIVIEVDNLEVTIAKLTAAGVTFRNELINGVGG